MSEEDSLPDKFSTYQLDRHCVRVANDLPLDLDDAISSIKQMISSASYLQEILKQLQSGNTNLSSDSDESNDMYSEAEEQVSDMFRNLVEIHCHVEHLYELQHSDDENDLENQGEDSADVFNIDIDEDDNDRENEDSDNKSDNESDSKGDTK